MASGKGRTLAVKDLGDKRLEMLHGQLKRADTSRDTPGRQMNRNATWPAEKGGHQQNTLEMPHGRRKRVDTSSDRPGRQMNGNATWSAEKGGHHMASGKGRTPAVTDLGDK